MDVMWETWTEFQLHADEKKRLIIYPCDWIASFLWKCPFGLLNSGRIFFAIKDRSHNCTWFGFGVQKISAWQSSKRSIRFRKKKMTVSDEGKRSFSRPTGSYLKNSKLQRNVVPWEVLSWTQRKACMWRKWIKKRNVASCLCIFSSTSDNCSQLWGHTTSPKKVLSLPSVTPMMAGLMRGCG